MPDKSESMCVIANFAEFLTKCLQNRVSEFSLESLEKRGGHFGSVLLLAHVKLSRSDESEIGFIQLVIKTPVTNPFLIKLFQPAWTFVKEVRFYTDIIPTIEQFEQDTNVPENERMDAFFRYFGSRISLDPNATCADADAVLMLENVTVQNYDNIDRFQGFEMDEILTILRQIAKFHSLCIAIRRQKPELFDAKIRPHLKGVNMVLKEKDDKIVRAMNTGLRFVDGLDSKLRQHIENQLMIGHNFLKNITNSTPDTPYTTVVHKDLWINNIMIKKDSSQAVPIKIKIYDFQLYYYQSFVHDLMFFLCMCVRPNELISNFKLLIDYYHAEFLKTLDFVNVPKDDYTFEKMWLEIKERAKFELMHILFMQKISFVDYAASVDEISKDTFTKNQKPTDDILHRWRVVIDLFTQHDFF